MREHIAFTLPFALPSLNAVLRTHWAKRSRAKAELSQAVMAAIGGPFHFPPEPWRRVRVTITREGRKLLDVDNLAGSCKAVVDCLCVRSATHPHGLGIVQDDRPELMDMVFRQSVTRYPCTVVLIERLD